MSCSAAGIPRLSRFPWLSISRDEVSPGTLAALCSPLPVCIKDICVHHGNSHGLCRSLSSWIHLSVRCGVVRAQTLRVHGKKAITQIVENPRRFQEILSADVGPPGIDVNQGTA
eukprot:5696203-Pyramimonas_sp.AAC.2